MVEDTRLLRLQIHCATVQAECCKAYSRTEHLAMLISRHKDLSRTDKAFIVRQLERIKRDVTFGWIPKGANMYWESKDGEAYLRENGLWPMYRKPLP